nr:thioesterase family protein [uncultured Polaribacter sp.]
MNFEVSFNTKWSDFDPNRHMRHTAYNDYAAEVRVRFLRNKISL